MKYLVITVDTNDADWSESINHITDEELELLKPVFAAIRAFKPYTVTWQGYVDQRHSSNWPYGESLREDLGERSPQEIYPELSEEQIQLFEDKCPKGDIQYGFHSVVRISIIEGIELIYMRAQQ